MNRDTSLYIVTFNSPPQLQLLFDSILAANPELLQINRKYLIDNSTDTSTTTNYNIIAAKYGFDIIRNGNMGICGARQWAASHFHNSGSQYMIVKSLSYGCCDNALTGSDLFLNHIRPEASSFRA
jgi:hypothetical protein